jgi:predicted nucleotide-binding protein
VRIEPKLIASLQKRLQLGKAQTYKRIAATARARMLESRLAAIALAAEQGLNISRFASPEDLAKLRGSPLTSLPAPSVAARKQNATRRVTVKGTRKPAGKTVWVVHGRNEKLRKSLFRFIRAIGLNPLEFGAASALTNKGAPYVGEILDTAFRKAAAIVVLLTPDDEARLKPIFQKANDPPFETTLTGQARPNVLFEAGMAFGNHPESTVLVQVGDVRPFSNVAGRHVVHLSNDVAARHELVAKLRAAKCDVDDAGTDWHTEGDFSI